MIFPEVVFRNSYHPQIPITKPWVTVALPDVPPPTVLVGGPTTFVSLCEPVMIDNKKPP
jgi:hypothetical protein